jgi:hypothetical protein
MATPRRSLNRVEIETLLTKVLDDIGPERFSSLRLLDLERLTRTYNPDLGGKTVLREVINKFRSARWESCRPKQLYRR